MRTSNVMEKNNKKKTLTISSDLKKKIDTTSVNTDGKKSFAVKKKNLLEVIKILIELIKTLIQQKPKISKRKTLQESLLNNKLQKLL